MRPALAAFVALAPGLLVWLGARRLVRSAGDPALPERVHAWRQRSVAAFATGAALLVVLFSSELAWTLPLLVLVVLGGGFPVRRALFGETWGLASYLVHVVRAVLGFAGFWLLVMAAPVLVSWATPREWVMAAVLASLLLAWGLLHDRVLLRLLRAVPLDRPDLETRLATIAARSTAPMPRLFMIGAPGGRWANGLALPSTGRPAVAFTRTLLEELDADEIAAIFAHEQAHLEHFDRRRLIRLSAVQTTVVLLGTLGAALVLSRLGAATLVVTAGWPLTVGLGLVIRMARHQAHEADSDRRAAELCGDPDALARGLVRLHQLALFPRRLELEREQWESHPSLASRLRALRALADQGSEAAGVPSGERHTPSSAVRLPASLAGEAAGVWLVFEKDQAHWLEGVPEDPPREPGALRATARRARSLAYAELVEARLKPRSRDRHDLVATDRTGASWTLALAPGEGTLAQSALDAIDDRLSPTAVAPRGYQPVAAIVAAAGTIAALLALSAALVPGLVAVFVPHPGPLAALGAALVVSALASPPADGIGLLQAIPSSLRLAAFLAFGATALGLAWATAWRERAGRTRSAPWMGLLLSLAAAAPLLPVFFGLVTGSAFRLHLAARQHPAGAILLAAAAAAFLVSPRGWSRALGVAAALLAALTLTLASNPFADRFVHDPLWAKQGPTPPPVALRLLAEHPLPRSTTVLRLSSSGRSWLARGYDRDHDSGVVPRERLVVGSVSGVEHAHHALDLVLIDDERLLALHESTDALALACGRHDPSEPEEWRLTLPALVSPRLAVDSATGVWQVGGVEPRSGELVRLQGDLAGHPPREDRWPADDSAGQWLVSADSIALGVGYAFDEGDWLDEEGGLDGPAALADATGLWWLLAGLSGGTGTRILALDADGSRQLLASQLTVQCDEPPLGVAVFVCRANAGERTSLWEVDPSTPRQRLLGVVGGFAGPPRPAASGGIVLVHEGWGQSVYRLGEAGLVRLDRPDASDGSPWVVDVAGFSEGVGVVVTAADGRPRLRLYARDDSVSASATEGGSR